MIRSSISTATPPNKRVCRRKAVAPPSLVKYAHVLYEELEYAPYYETRSRAQLKQDADELDIKMTGHAEVKKELHEHKLALVKERDELFEQRAFAEQFLSGVNNQIMKNGTRMKENERQYGEEEAEESDDANKRTTVEYMLHHDLSNHYAVNPMSFVQQDLNLTDPSDTNLLNQQQSCGTLNKMRNLGLEHNSDWNTAG